MPSILHIDRGFLALFSPVVFLSGLSWPRRVLWVSQLCQHWLFIWSSSGTNKCFQPKAPKGSWWASCHNAFRGRICSWVSSEILLGLRICKCNFQRNFCIWPVCLWQAWKKLLQSELPSEVDYLRESQGDECLTSPARARSRKVLRKWVWLPEQHRRIYIDAACVCGMSSGTLVFCWCSWVQPLCHSWFFNQLSRASLPALEITQIKYERSEDLVSTRVVLGLYHLYQIILDLVLLCFSFFNEPHRLN